MADYLIQESTLDAIARAINDKAGTQVAMTPAQMVTAIGSISGGSPSPIVDYTTTEDVSIISITNFPSNYKLYLIELTGETSAIEWIYINLINNSNPGSLWWGESSNTGLSNWSTKIHIMLTPTGNGYPVTETQKCYMSTGARGLVNVPLADSGISSISFKLYNAASKFLSGFNVKVWGYDAR